MQRKDVRRICHYCGSMFYEQIDGMGEVPECVTCRTRPAPRITPKKWALRSSGT